MLYVIEEFVELDQPKQLNNDKWYVGVVGESMYYLRDDGRVHYGTMASPFTDINELAYGFFGSEEDATLARLKYYKDHDMFGAYE